MSELRRDGNKLSLDTKLEIASKWALGRIGPSTRDMLFYRQEFDIEEAKQEAMLRAWKTFEKGGTISQASMAAYRGIQDYIRRAGNISREGKINKVGTVPFSQVQRHIGEEEGFGNFDPESDFDLEKSVIDTMLGEDVLEILSERSKRILLMHHSFDITMKDIGEEYGITESRVSQIINKAERKIRNVIEQPERIVDTEGKRSISVDEHWILQQIDR